MRQLKITHSITNRDIKSLDKYLQDICSEELLTPEEEVLLRKSSDCLKDIISQLDI